MEDLSDNHFTVRLYSFKNWKLINPTARDLAEVGFYYMGYEDVVKCFDCSIELSDWEFSDDPLLVHLRFARKYCNFIRIFGYKVLQECMVNKNIKYFRQILENYNNDQQEEELAKMLVLSIQNGSIDFTQALLQIVSPNYMQNNKAPIHLAVEHNQIEILSLLLQEKSLNIDITTSTHQSALHIAVKNNNILCAELLLKHNINVNITNHHALTALHLAAKKNNREMVELIMQYSPNLSYVDYIGQSTWDLLQNKYPDLISFESNEIIHQTTIIPIDIFDLKYYIITGKKEKFKELFTLCNTLTEEQLYELLKMTVERGWREIIKDIMLRIENKSISFEIIEIIIYSGYYNIFHDLLPFMETKFNNKILMMISSEIGSECHSNEKLEDLFKCMQVLLSTRKIDINYQNGKLYKIIIGL